jgi:hypothetical protein
MNKYKIIFEQTESYIVDVYAQDEQDAITKAEECLQNGSYQETGEYNVEMVGTYDVTNTDDPFHPENEQDSQFKK